MSNQFLYTRPSFNKITIRSEQELDNYLELRDDGVWKITDIEIYNKILQIASAFNYHKKDLKWSVNWGKKNDKSMRDPVERYSDENLVKYVRNHISEYPYKFNMESFYEEFGRRALAYVLGYNTSKSNRLFSKELNKIDKQGRPSVVRYKIVNFLPHNNDDMTEINAFIEPYLNFLQTKRERIQRLRQIEQDLNNLQQDNNNLTRENRILRRNNRILENNNEVLQRGLEQITNLISN